MDSKVLEPSKYYESQGKKEHHDNIETYFNELVNKSGINIPENQETISNWKNENQKIASLSKKIKTYKVLRAFLIVGIVIGALLSLISLILFQESVGLGCLFLIIGVFLIVGSIIVMVKKVNATIKSIDKIRQEHTEQAKMLENQAWSQMKCLNDLFTDEDAIRLIEKTLPDFSFDKNFSVQQERVFTEQYDFYDLQTEETSMVNTVSGRYAGNPFLFARRRVHKMGTHEYHGSLTISWTETYRDSYGNIKRQRKTQTLHATVTKPKPYYHMNTFLMYGNQAAPSLSFTHNSQHIEKLSDKELSKKVKKGEKQLQKQAKKAVKAGGSFQEMTNAEFDVLFGATDRDNEVEFRLMYTPLGQRGTVSLMKDRTNYGDDFDFLKRGKCNVIISDHAQKWEMSLFANDYKHMDFEETKKRFFGLNESYFKSVFFDFAPLFCVPAYLEEPCVALEDDAPYNMNYTCYEHEVMANALGYKNFVDSQSCTEAILKTRLVKTADGNDFVAVTANSYMGIDRIDYVPVKGGDGNYHNVPVPWIEYVPIRKTSHILVHDEQAPTEYTSLYYHGMGVGMLDS